MNLYSDDTLTIFFGDASDQLYMPQAAYDTFSTLPHILDSQPFSKLRSIMNIEQILFPRQVHGTDGLVITQNTHKNMTSFTTHADYSMTNRKRIGIGVLTADCLPIILHDQVHQAIAVIHAGWRGSLAKIALNAVQQMYRLYETQTTDLRVFFGPCAGPCCYTVGKEIIQAVKPFQQDVLINKDNLIFFDLITYNQILLEKAGVKPQAFCRDFSQCTICNDQFWSFRRQQAAAGRQMTVACLTRE